jgi:perosamine synthetase
VTDERTASVYRQAVAREFALLKSTSTLEELWARAIPLPDAQGALVPVCELHADDVETVATLARWRAENELAFPTRFPVTVEGTARWLRSGLLDVADRILFLVCDRHGHAVGHLGFAGCLNPERELEVDNVVRGVKDREPGLMSIALQRLLDWADEMFQPTGIFLHVFADNNRAVAFYRRLGFRSTGTIDLERVIEGERVSFVPCRAGRKPDAVFLRMDYAPEPLAEPVDTILTAGPSISPREVSYAVDATRYGWNRRWADYLTRFEQAFAEYVGAKHAIATSSCTGALHLSMLACGIGPGDEVIVPEITWVATANAVAYTGATPVFADVDEISWTMDPASVEAVVSAKTKAIVPVHLYGHPARMAALVELAARYGLVLIEDAAPAIGAEVAGRRVGTFGSAGCFSFQGAKLLVTGEGGMLVTNDDDVYERAKYLWDQGRAPGGNFWITELGWKYKLSNVQAAIGLGQLERCDELVEAKRRIFSWYEDGLAGVPGIQLAREADWGRSIYWMSSIRVKSSSGLDRDRLRDELAARKVDTRVVFPPVSTYPLWPWERRSAPVAESIGAEGINLPSGVRLRRDEVAYVCRAIRETVSQARAALRAA